MNQSLLGTMLLDYTYEKIYNTNNSKIIDDVMDNLVHGLKELRSYLSIDAWNSFTRKCLDHPLRKIIHHDIFTERAFSKPRGYAGDAVMMDYIYKLGEINSDINKMNEIGKAIYDYTSSSLPATCSVRIRREIIANKIDELTENINQPHILSVACGHLREAEISQSVKNNKIGRYVAFDYDLKSLNIVKEDYNKYGIECVQGNIKDVVSGKSQLDKFDFIYTAGLYDYLSQGIARKVTEKLFNSLNSGGKLLIGNFLPNIIDVGYMETFMDWKLIYRDPYDMEDMAEDIESSQIKYKHTFIEENKNVIFLEIGAN